MAVIQNRKTVTIARQSISSGANTSTGRRRMKIPALPFTVTDWSKVAATTHAGESGQAFWRTLVEWSFNWQPPTRQ
jgi:hypothetical protein